MIEFVVNEGDLGISIHNSGIAEPTMSPPKQRGQKDEKGYEEAPEELRKSSRPTTSRTQLDLPLETAEMDVKEMCVDCAL